MATASNGNGKTTQIPREPPASIAELREQKELMDARNDWKQARLMEAWLDNSYTDFAGSDLFYQMRYRDSDGSHWVPLSVPSDRQKGGNWPIWRTEQDLARLRQQSRMLCEANGFAKATLRNLTNYTIGVGFTYSARLKDKIKSVPGTQANPNLQILVEAVQRCVDIFLERNRWNTKVDPKLDQTCTGNREREAYRRVKRDGEAFLRFFYAEGGETYVRFVEPEQVWNPAGGTWAQGWSYGIQHQTHPFEDVEHVLAYHVVPQDPSAITLEQQEKLIGMGEAVQACDIVHIKKSDDDAALKRGTPEFVWDTFDAFTRAAKLQRNLSVASAVRAATAEIWQHQSGTKEQINRLAMGHAESTRTDPVTNRSVITEKMLPGAIRRIPAGQEAVPVQADPGASGLIAVVQGDLRQAVTGFCAPEYFTGDASNANYASTNVAGAPFVRASEAEQEHFKQAFLQCVWKAVRHAIRCGHLPPEVLDAVEIDVDAPKVLVRDELQRAQEDQIAVTTGWKSPETCAVERGLDWDTEQQRIDEHSQRMGMGGGGGDLASMLGNMGGGPQQRMESLWEGDWDEGKHKRADDGTFGSGGGKATSTASKIGKRGRRVMRLLAATGKKILSGAVKIEHAAKEFIVSNVAKLPKPARLAVLGVYHTAFATYTAAQTAAQTVANERGLSQEQMDGMAKGLMAADIVLGGKVLPATLGAIGLGPLAAAASFIPVASLSYLAFSTATDPMAVLKAAKRGVKAAMKVSRLKESAEWDEGKHPRSDGGKFARKGGGTVAHAPRGGITLGKREFKSGEAIAGEHLKGSTSEQRKQLHGSKPHFLVAGKDTGEALMVRYPNSGKDGKHVEVMPHEKAQKWADAVTDVVTHNHAELIGGLKEDLRDQMENFLDGSDHGELENAVNELVHEFVTRYQSSFNHAAEMFAEAYKRRFEDELSDDALQAVEQINQDMVDKADAISDAASELDTDGIDQYDSDHFDVLVDDMNEAVKESIYSLHDWFTGHMDDKQEALEKQWEEEDEVHTDEADDHAQSLNDPGQYDDIKGATKDAAMHNEEFAKNGNPYRLWYDEESEEWAFAHEDDLDDWPGKAKQVKESRQFIRHLRGRTIMESLGSRKS